MSKKTGSSPPPSMDALTAHLDRGWDLLRKNDLRAAEISAKNALEVDAESPEAMTLLGAIAAAEGDDEEALEQYRRAMEIDPEFVSPMLYAAELLLGPEGDPDEALKLIEDALELAEDEDEYLDALLLKVEALLQAGDSEEEAKQTLDELPEDVQFGDPIYHLRAGRCFFDVGDLENAFEHLARCVSEEPDNADAWHVLGMVHEEQGNDKLTLEAWLKVRELDLAAPAPPWGISADELAEIADRVMGEMPDRIRELLVNVPILAADYPDEVFVRDGGDPRVLGFFTGVPYPEKQAGVGHGHLDTIHLYQRNIERMCHSRDMVREEVRVTILHETAHFFGLSEEEVEALGLA